jgi:hypothetical protein
MRYGFPLLFIGVAVALAARSAGKPAPPVPAAKIATGAPLVVDSETDPSFALINARVDIGRLRQVGDALEAELAWTLRYGVLNDARAARPGVTIAEGSTSVSRERVVCRAAGALSYGVETRIVSPDGKVLDRRSLDAAASRQKAEAQEEAMAKLSPLGASYGPDPRSLVCWAAARKCEGRDFTWPPPPNRTPLEYSERADAMRKAYAATFVPSCKLPS